MESQAQNPEFRMSPENFHPLHCMSTGFTLTPLQGRQVQLSKNHAYFNSLFTSVVTFANSLDPDKDPNWIWIQTVGHSDGFPERIF